MVARGDGKFGPWGWPQNPSKPKNPRTAVSRMYEQVLVTPYFQHCPLSVQKYIDDKIIMELINFDKVVTDRYTFRTHQAVRSQNVFQQKVARPLICGMKVIHTLYLYSAKHSTIHPHIYKVHSNSSSSCLHTSRYKVVGLTRSLLHGSVDTAGPTSYPSGKPKKKTQLQNITRYLADLPGAKTKQKKHKAIKW